MGSGSFLLLQPPSSAQPGFVRPGSPAVLGSGGAVPPEEGADGTAAAVAEPERGRVCLTRRAAAAPRLSKFVPISKHLAIREPCLHQTLRARQLEGPAAALHM